MQIMSNVIVECQIISETLFFYKVYEDLMTAALCGGCSSRWTTVLESLLAPSFDSASQHLFHLDFILYRMLVKVKVEVYYSKTFYFYCNFLFLFLNMQFGTSMAGTGNLFVYLRAEWFSYFQ